MIEKFKLRIFPFQRIYNKCNSKNICNYQRKKKEVDKDLFDIDKFSDLSINCDSNCRCQNCFKKFSKYEKIYKNEPYPLFNWYNCY